jgi:formamidopyrimidine-DNA glycosylase
MPELPDLEIIREYLAPRLPGVAVTGVDTPRPLIVRNLAGGEPADALPGRRFTGVARRGKNLLLSLDSGVTIVITPMLAGRIRYAAPLGKKRVRDALILSLDNGMELRYHDAKDMGKVYIVADLNQAPGMMEMGPEADDPALTREVFRERLKKHQGEIKGVLTNQRFVAGIGNAYADEILWCAAIYPMRRRASLSEQEVERLYNCMRIALQRAVETLRERVGDRIDVEVRDFLAIHGKDDGECPRCGGRISTITYERSTTYFCRNCQPGLMVNKGRSLELPGRN